MDVRKQARFPFGALCARAGGGTTEPILWLRKVGCCVDGQLGTDVENSWLLLEGPGWSVAQFQEPHAEVGCVSVHLCGRRLPQGPFQGGSACREGQGGAGGQVLSPLAPAQGKGGAARDSAVLELEI